MTETIYTIGHSTHEIGEFIGLLQDHGIEVLADVRTIPKSGHNPQYGQAALKASLKKHHIAYVHMKELGGLRHAQKESPNRGWRNASFRGYADYMQTEAFDEALRVLIAAGKKRRTAIMCAESVPWRCHRSLVADALTVHGVTVLHIMPDGKLSPHKMTAFAHIRGKEITYPPEQPGLPGLL